MKIGYTNKQQMTCANDTGCIKLMKYVHPCFKSKAILNFIDELITEDGYSSFDHFSQQEKELLTGLFIRASEETDHYTSKSNDAFIKALISQSPLDNLAFISSMKREAISHWDETMRNLFAERLENYESEKIFEQGQMIDHAYDTWRDSI